MVLESMVARKRVEVEKRMRDRPLEKFRSDLSPSDRSLCKVLRKQHTSFILECKRASPSKGIIRADFNPADIAVQYTKVADAISVLCDHHYFQGELDHLRQVREVVDCPVLCKDIVVHPYQLYEARRYGADAILLMLSVLDPKTFAECVRITESLGMDALVEVRDRQELEVALECGVNLLGINNRNLKTLEVSLETTEMLAPLVPESVILISESGIQDHRDVLRLRHLVDGFLVGSSLMQRTDLDKAVYELVYGRVKVCGLTRVEDVEKAYQAGASWGGFIFAEKSPRKIDLDKAMLLRQAADLCFAGVFVNQDPNQVAQLAARLELDAVQMHGEDAAEQLGWLRKVIPASCEIWRAVRVFDHIPAVDHTCAQRLVLDTYQQGRYGGTGKVFDWEPLRSYSQKGEVILAGGLNTANAEQADRIGVWALDINSGVEESPGLKSEPLLLAFFSALRGKGRERSGE